MADKKETNIDVNIKVNGADKLKDAKEGIEDISKSGSKLPGIFGEGSEAILGLVEGIGKMTKAAMAFIATPLGAVIAAIAVAIGAVKAAFTSSEEGQNKFAKMMGVISAIGVKIIDIFDKIGEVIIKAFEDPQKAINSFVELIKTNIMNRFNGFLELIPKIGEALNDLFHGNFAEAGKVAGDAVAKVTLGVDHMSDKIKSASEEIAKFTKEAKEAGNVAAKVADMRAKADKEERALSTEKAKLESKIAELRERAADKEGVSAAERKAAILEAQKLDEQLFDKQRNVYQLRADAQTLELSVSEKTKENLTKEAEARNKVIELDGEEANSKKKLARQLRSINKEQAADAKKQADEKAKAEKDAENEAIRLQKEQIQRNAELQKDTKSFIDETAKLKDNEIKDDDARLAAKQQAEIDKLTEQYALKTDMGIEATQALMDGTKAIEEKYADESKKLKDKALEDTKRRHQEELDSKKRQIDEQAALEQNYVNAVQGLSDIVFAIKSAGLKKGSKEELEAAKKQFNINKALQITGAVINGAKAITTSLAESPIAIGPIPNPAGIASLAFAVINTAASIAKIASTQFQGGESTASVNAPSSSPSASAAVPSAKSNFTPQSLQKIGGSGLSGFNPSMQQGTTSAKDQPVQKIYVVSQDITTSQNKDAVLTRRASFNV